MAKRPVFIPDFSGQNIFQERLIEFKWSSGFAEVQKKKNIRALHNAAKETGLSNILEISTKSDDKIGQRLSAFNLMYEIDGKSFPLESVYQGSKVFKDGGPFTNIFEFKPRDARKFIRELKYGNLTSYNFQKKYYPLSPPNAFYDWLYIRSLINHADWIEKNVKFEAFTDIEFNPEKQINCQARAFAEYLSLLNRGKLYKACRDFDYFNSLITNI